MIPEAVAAVVDSIQDANIDRGDGKTLTVTGFMPLPGEADQPSAVAVYFDGMDPTEFGVTVAAIVATSSSIPFAEALMQTVVPAIDAALDDDTPRSTWARTWSAEYGSYIYTTTLAYPRADF